eukprot:NODE_382_length_9640_cov_0.243476.p1 type:complete len:1029 gc:universal NODE_382_length_9640_cov_0.243476:2469-5555(+)
MQIKSPVIFILKTMASVLSIENIELKDWVEDIQYSKALKIRNDGLYSQRFIYYIVGNFFHTPYIGTCFLPPGLTQKVDISFLSKIKQDISEKLIIKTAEGSSVEVQLKATIINSKIEILDKHINLFRILCFEEVTLVFKVLNKTSEVLACSLNMNNTKKKYDLKTGLNEISFLYSVKYPGSFSEDAEIECDDDRYIIAISGYAELPQLRVKIADCPNSSPTTANYFNFEVENISCKSFLCNYTVISKESNVEILKNEVFKPSNPVKITIPFCPPYFNFKFNFEVVFYLNNFQIYKAFHENKSIKANLSCLSQDLKLFLDLDRGRCTTDYISLRNDSNCPIKVYLFCDMEELKFEPYVVIERKEFKRIPVVFTPKYPAFFKISINLLTQGSDLLIVNCVCQAKSVKSESFKIQFHKNPQNPPVEIQFSSIISKNQVQLTVNNATNDNLLFYLPQELSYACFSIKTTHKLVSVNRSSIKTILFEFQFHQPFYHYLILNFETEEKLYFYPLLIYSFSEVLSSKEFDWTTCKDQKYFWCNQLVCKQSGVILAGNVYPKVLKNEHSNLIFMFSEPIAIKSLNICPVSVEIHYNKHGGSIEIKNTAEEITKLTLKFQTVHPDGYTIFPCDTQFVLLPLEVREYKILLVQKKKFTDTISILVDNTTACSFHFTNPNSYKRGSNIYHNIGPLQAMHHIRTNKLLLNKDYINRDIKITVPLTINGQISASLESSSKILKGLYFEDYLFSEEQEKIMQLFDDEACKLNVIQRGNEVLLEFHFNLKECDEFVTKANVCVKSDTLCEFFVIDFNVLLREDYENKDLMERYCYNLQSPPTNAVSLKMVNYLSDVASYYRLSDDDLYISCNFKLLWLGTCSCGTMLKTPLVLHNNTNSTVNIRINSDTMMFEHSRMSIKPQEDVRLILTLSIDMMPTLFTHSLTVEHLDRKKNLYIGGLAASYVDTKILSDSEYINHKVSEACSNHMEEMSQSYLNELAAVLYSEVIDQNLFLETNGSETVGTQDHFQRLKTRFLDELLNFL